jgi:hypothetical protein
VLQNLRDIAGEIANRMIRIFTRDEYGERPVLRRNHQLSGI